MPSSASGRKAPSSDLAGEETCVQPPRRAARGEDRDRPPRIKNMVLHSQIRIGSDRSSVCGHHPTSPSMVRTGTTLDLAGPRRNLTTHGLPGCYDFPADYQPIRRKSPVIPRQEFVNEFTWVPSTTHNVFQRLACDVSVGCHLARTVGFRWGRGPLGGAFYGRIPQASGATRVAAERPSVTRDGPAFVCPETG